MKTMETMEAVSSDGMEKRVERRNWRQIAPCAREKPRDAKKVLANLWSRQRITKKAHAGRGPEVIWEIPGNMFPGSSGFSASGAADGSSHKRIRC
jgi:hypothetical protein